MGSAGSVAVQPEFLLTREQVSSFVAQSAFTADEIKALWVQFCSISSAPDGVDNTTITRREFQRALAMKNSLFSNRMFDVVDVDGDGTISFPEFVVCLSTLSTKGSTEAKLRFSFQVYDIDGDQTISREELTEMVKATIRENDLVLDDPQIASVVDATFDEVKDHDGLITFPQYTQLYNTHPDMLKQLTLNISSHVTEQVSGRDIPFADS